MGSVSKEVQNPKQYVGGTTVAKDNACIAKSTDSVARGGVTTDPPVAMEVGGSPPRATSRITSPVDLPESKLQPKGSLFQRRQPVPMELGNGGSGGDNGGNGNGNSTGNTGKPHISITSGDMQTSSPETENPPKPETMKIHAESSQAKPPADVDPTRLRVTHHGAITDELTTGTAALTVFSGALKGGEIVQGEQVHSPKTAWLRRHSDSNLPVEQRGGLCVAQEAAQTRSHSTGTLVFIPIIVYIF